MYLWLKTEIPKRTKYETNRETQFAVITLQGVVLILKSGKLKQVYVELLKGGPSNELNILYLKQLFILSYNNQKN